MKIAGAVKIRFYGFPQKTYNLSLNVFHYLSHQKLNRYTLLVQKTLKLFNFII